MHYLITGHTGFKGAWLTLWLTSLGHKVSGISLDPIPGALFEIANISELIQNDVRVDIRDAYKTADAIKNLAPDVVFHMAAQPLVRESYRDPRGTIETNVMGTLNVIEAVSETPSVKAQIVVTTDKVYRNINQVAGYVESDPLGGDDPYSASKAMADILTHSWVTSFKSPPTTIVRAGNVIGGGDVSKDRLMPDLVNSYFQNQSPVLRFPDAVRPWQHVLDCLNGYLKISEYLLQGKNLDEVNIGPDKEKFTNVSSVAETVAQQFGVSSYWQLDSGELPSEAGLLVLDSSRARTLLNWHDKLKFSETIQWTVDWYKKVKTGLDPLDVTRDQIEDFLSER